MKPPLSEALDDLKDVSKERNEILDCIHKCISECSNALDHTNFSDDLKSTLKILLQTHQSHIEARKDGTRIIVKLLEAHVSNFDATMALDKRVTSLQAAVLQLESDGPA